MKYVNLAGVTGDSIRAAVDPVDTHAADLGALADDLKGDPADIACPNCGQRGTLTSRF